MFQTARWVFSRVLGAIFFCAFFSLAGQIRGLFGERGIAPTASFLQRAQEQLGAAAYQKIPTLCWLGASDTTLVAMCWGGVALSVVLMAGVCPGLSALLLWALYLSLCAVGSPFMDFQWDMLLLETAFLAAFALPWKFRPDWRRHTRVARIAWLLLWWLNFRLMFESGLVKLTAGDPTWHQLTALQYHFETQPLPLPLGWFAHQLPALVLRLATALMFLIELGAPFLLITPRRWRHGGALALIALQVAILVTGNYTFFNLLSIALCVPLFDDAWWPARIRALLPPSTPPPEADRPWPLWLFAPVAFVIVLVTAAQLETCFHQRGTWTPGWRPPTLAIIETLQPLRSTNGYGLFRVMTTVRREIVIEGTDDGVNWRAYEFRYKPGDLRKRPRLATPHQPRLDWHMWFAALSDVQHSPWFVEMLARLLTNTPEVLALFESNPFPTYPPRSVRAVLYEYKFTRPGDDPTAWWKREPLGLYCPPLSLRE